MHKKLVCLALLLSACAASACATAPSTPPPGDVEVRRKALGDLLAEQWEYTLRTSPEFASILGDKRYNDRLSRSSRRTAIDEDLAETQRVPRALRGARPERASRAGAAQLGADGPPAAARGRGRGSKEWEMPVHQMTRRPPRSAAAGLGALVRDGEGLRRLRRAAARRSRASSTETTIQMRKGMARRLMPPKFLLPKVAAQARSSARRQAGGLAVRRAARRSFPRRSPTADKQRLRAAMLGAIRMTSLPAYRKLGAFVQEEYAPKGRAEAGLWSLPDGAARYAFDVKPPRPRT